MRLNCPTSLIWPAYGERTSWIPNGCLYPLQGLLVGKLHRRRRFGAPEGHVESVSSPVTHPGPSPASCTTWTGQGLWPHQPRSATWCTNSAAIAVADTRSSSLGRRGALRLRTPFRHTVGGPQQRPRLHHPAMRQRRGRRDPHQLSLLFLGNR